VTLHARVAAARQRLRDAGIPPDEADLDARLLAEHLLGWDAARFFTDSGDAEPAGFAPRYEALVARREAREPIAYITGLQQFWDLSFEVSPAVLIPRPESELIVEAALEAVPAREPRTIADICTGSGCLAVAIARERPNARLVATDISDAALDIARRNAARHGVGARIRLVPPDLFDKVAGPFDVIVSNPPYVPARDRDTLPPEVRDHEPAAALFAGDDGLEVVRRMLPQLPPRLKPGATAMFEIGFGQADAVEQLISATPGLRIVAVRRDLRGIPRTAVARRT